MPKYRIQTHERRWVYADYRITAGNPSDAIETIERSQPQPHSVTPDKKRSLAPGDARIISLVELQDEPFTVTGTTHKLDYQDEPIPEDHSDEDPETWTPDNRPPAEVKNYTVILVVPGDIQEKAGELETFVAYVRGISAVAAIKDAKQQAANALHCADLAEKFMPLIVFNGWRPDLSLPKE